MGLTMSQRKAVTKVVATRYARKGRILDELCATTGGIATTPARRSRARCIRRWSSPGLRGRRSTVRKSLRHRFSAGRCWVCQPGRGWHRCWWSWCRSCGAGRNSTSDLVDTDVDQPAPPVLVEHVGRDPFADRADRAPRGPGEAGDRGLVSLGEQPRHPRSSTSRVWPDPSRANGTPSVRTPCSGQRSRLHSNTIRQIRPPMSRGTVKLVSWLVAAKIGGRDRIVVVQGARLPGRDHRPLRVAVSPVPAELSRGRGADAGARRRGEL